MGGYFFLLLQTLITRPMTLTRRIQNWNKSAYVTIVTAPFRKVRGRQKEVSPLLTRWGAARLPFIGSTDSRIPHFSAKCKPGSDRIVDGFVGGDAHIAPGWLSECGRTGRCGHRPLRQIRWFRGRTETSAPTELDFCTISQKKIAAPSQGCGYLL